MSSFISSLPLITGPCKNRDKGTNKKKKYKTVEEIRTLLNTTQWIFLTILSAYLPGPVINGSRERKAFKYTQIEAALGRIAKLAV